MEEVKALLKKYSNFVYELREDREKIANIIVQKMILLPDIDKYILYVYITTEMTGQSIPNAEILLKKIVDCDLLGPEIMAEERTKNYNILPEWAQKLVK
jgi:hypothetical protein